MFITILSIYLSIYLFVYLFNLLFIFISWYSVYCFRSIPVKGVNVNSLLLYLKIAIV